MAKAKQDLLKQSLALSLGLMDLTRDKLGKMVKEVQKNVTEKEKKQAVEQLFKSAKAAKKQAEDMMRKQIKRALDELGIATKDDLKKSKR